jgi:hypothetical protein
MLKLAPVLGIDLPCELVAQPGRLGHHVVQPIEHFTEPLRGERLSFPFVGHTSRDEIYDIAVTRVKLSNLTTCG